MTRALPIVALTTLLAACSGKDDPRPDGVVSPDRLGSLEKQASTCGPGIYPCGPYGARVGDIAENLEFVGYKDPEEHCDANTAKQLDLSKLAQLSFKDFYLGDKAKSCVRKLLWVMVSAGWCTPCKAEVPKVQADYAAGKIDNRVAVLNLLFDADTVGDPATSAYLLTWINAFKLTFPAAIDPKFTMGAYFEKTKVPFNMLVDLSNMKIFYQQSGGDITVMNDKINAFFNP